MPLRYVGEYIDQIRRTANVLDSSSTNGVSSTEIVQYIDEGQSRLQSRISSRFPTTFEFQATFSPVANQEEYDFPSNVYTGSRIKMLEYSPTGNARDYYPLRQAIILDRSNVSVNYPSHYIIRGSKILITPTINNSTGTFRVVYERQLPRLDIRRGKVSSAANSGGYYTTITLDGAFDNDDTELAMAEYITVVDKHGTIIYSGISVDSYDSATDTITIDANTAPTSTGTIAAGNYVVLGKFSTTHSQLHEPCERYLISYGTWKTQKKDSNQDYQAQETELAAMENDIVETFSANERDIFILPYTEDFL